MPIISRRHACAAYSTRVSAVSLDARCVALGLVLAGCQPSAVPSLAAPLPAPSSEPRDVAQTAVPSAEFVVSLLGLNDLHGRLGALPAFAGYVAALRRAHGSAGAVLVVDAGDMFQGTLSSNVSEGASVIEAYNALGVNVAAIGNHEFDYGPVDGKSEGVGILPQGALRRRLAEARFPLLSANLAATDSGALPTWENLFSDTLLEVGPLRLGFVGGLTEETPAIVMPDYFAGLTVKALAPAVERSARALRSRGANAVVALVHAGGDCASTADPHDLRSCDSATGEVFRLAYALPKGALDAIVGGHTHARVAHVVNGVAIVEGASRGKAFNRIDLRFERASKRLLAVLPFPPEPLCPDAAELAPCSTHEYSGLAVSPDAELTRLIEPHLASARRARERALDVEVLAEFPLEHDHESALGNLLADAMRAEAPGADLAITNGGGLRAKLAAGALSYGALYEVVPFDNRLVTFELSAAELATVLRAHLTHDAHGIISISGIHVVARCQGEQVAITLTRPDGRVVPKTARLSLVTSDYLATGGDRLFAPLGLARERLHALGSTLQRDALALELARRKRLDPHDPALFDPARPRLALKAPRPLGCARR